MARAGREALWLATQIADILRGADDRIRAFLRSVDEPGALADTAGYSPDLTFEDKVELLEASGQHLTVLPTHRLVHGIGDDAGASILARAHELFDVEPVTTSEGLPETMRGAGATSSSSILRAIRRWRAAPK